MEIITRVCQINDGTQNLVESSEDGKEGGQGIGLSS